MSIKRGHKRFGWHACPELEYPPASRAQDVGDHRQSEGVLLALGAGQEGRRGLRPVRGRKERSLQPSKQVVGDCRREVLVGNRDGVTFPQVADPAHRGSDDPRADSGAVEARLQRHLDRLLGGNGVRVPECLRIALRQQAGQRSVGLRLLIGHGVALIGSPSLPTRPLALLLLSRAPGRLAPFRERRGPDPWQPGRGAGPRLRDR